MNDPLMPFLVVVVTLVILLFMQRWIHAHLHGVSLLLVGRPEWAIAVYAIVLFPGVMLHEVSHWLSATLLGVRTGGFSLIPRRQPDGSLQLGYVEYYKGRTLGPLRESLIGGAPLLAGTAVILLIGHRVFGVTDLVDAFQTGDVRVLGEAMSQVLNAPGALAWLYLIFAISNAMLPSRSDRHAWPAALVIVFVLLVTLAYLTRDTAVVDSLARPVATFFTYLGTALAIAIAVDLLWMLFIATAEWLLGRARGLSVVYGGQTEEV